MAESCERDCMRMRVDGFLFVEELLMDFVDVTKVVHVAVGVLPGGGCRFARHSCMNSSSVSSALSRVIAKCRVCGSRRLTAALEIRRDFLTRFSSRVAINGVARSCMILRARSKNPVTSNFGCRRLRRVRLGCGFGIRMVPDRGLVLESVISGAGLISTWVRLPVPAGVMVRGWVPG